ncbi:hypothetical protein SAMN05660895_1201 [Thermoflavifilum thermophilum]|uniref:Uncharacterized protein n=2 Tax=Thermoflavifilum thermophilum TaxID=1393122 RepID=A0A1I7NB30_9BACT|nr:hypothetical protein SAMN05660895_1201 [Thermoflavifilum thermophilum]
MAYKDIVSISGLPGLYEMVSSKAEGGIVRSLEDRTTRFVSARQHRFTPIETIEVFTTGANVPLQEVFKAMQQHEDKHPVPDGSKADEKTLRDYFDQVFPELDDDRVYFSDLKKMVRWYAQLRTHGLLQFDTEPAQAEAAQEAAQALAAEQPLSTAEEEKNPRKTSRSRKKKES